MNELPLALRRLIAIGLLLLLVALLGSYGVAPWLEHLMQRQTRVEMLQRQLQGNQNLLANESLIDEQLTRIEQLSGEQALLFTSTKPALAAADLRELIGEVVADSGGQLVSVQEYEAESLAGTRAIGLRAHLTGEAQNLNDILYALESARPAIFIDKLKVSTSRRSTLRNSRRLRARPNSSLARRNSLDIRLDLSAYIVAGL